MNYRRRHNQRQTIESSFLRNWRFELPREALGKAAEWSGAAAGLLAAAAATRQGLALPSSVVSAGGLMIGATVGIVAKAAVSAGLDTLKSRRQQVEDGSTAQHDDRQSDATPDGHTIRLIRPGIPSRSWRRGPSLGRRSAGMRGIHRVQAVSAGSVITEMDRIIATMDRTHHDLVGAMDRINSNHAWLMTVLAGANPSLLQQINGQLSGARRAVEEACTMLRTSKDSLRAYTRTI
ncbi:hypothetical protein [Micromonospora sp. NPDC005979]|uniref:hypothetical protein n=1 Tax=Micromonospora sp. NPDC005979 TaxID=3156726 RepID=UPI0033A33628